MKIALLGHGNVGRGVSYIIDNGKTSFIKHLEIKKILVKDESEATDERMVFNIDDALDDDIDIVEKIGTSKRHYKLSYDNLAQLVGIKYGSSVIQWMNDVQPRLKYMIRINELYYSIVSKKRKAKAGNRNTFCQINPLDKQSWKAKTENKVIVWK